MMRLGKAVRFAWLGVAAVVGAASILTLAKATSTSPDDPALWLAQSRGITRVTAAKGEADFEIPVQTGVRAVAADRSRGTVWALTQKSLLAHDRAGTFLFEIGVSGAQGEPADLALDAASGVAWLVLHSRVSAYDAAGGHLVQRDLPNPLSATALDAKRSRFWYAVGDTLEALDDTGTVARSLRLAGTKSVPSMAYAAETDRLWIVADDRLVYVDPDTAVQTVVAQNKVFKAVAAIESDGSGGLWASDGKTLYTLDGNGTIVRQLRPFQGQSPELLAGLAADPADSSVWVASQRSLAHVQADGSVRIRTVPDPGDGKTRLIQRLSLETGAARPRIEILDPAAEALLNTARPTLRLSYSGADLDLESIAVTADDVPLAVTCETLPGTGSCVPDQSLADGSYMLAATIANASGDASEPATVHITIDTTPPAISATSPADGFLTNDPSLTLRGSVSEASTLTINGSPVAVQNLQFSFGPVTLTEGANTFALRATDAAGNVGTLALGGVLDTIPPPAPAQDRIQISASGGQITATGGAGSVEGGATVTLVNLSSGTQVSVTANADGSFSAALAGNVGDEGRIFATDAAGNQGAATTVVAAGSGPFGGPISISTMSPANGTTVTGDFILFTMDLQAPPNTGVTVNDVIAAAIPGPAGLRFHAVVPLQTGANTLNIEVHAQDGRVVTRTVSVTSTGPFPYRLVADRVAGVAPLDVQFDVLDQLGRGILQVQVDFNNDGIIDATSDGTSPITHTFSGEGLRQARVIIFDSAGQGHVQVLSVLLLSPALIDQSIQSVWSAMNDALAAGDSDGALPYLSPGAQEQYGPIFEVLLPKMPEILASYSPLQQSLASGNYAEYGVNRFIDGTNRVFLIVFVTNEYGQWKVESM